MNINSYHNSILNAVRHDRNKVVTNVRANQYWRDTYRLAPLFDLTADSTTIKNAEKVLRRAAALEAHNEGTTEYLQWVTKPKNLREIWNRHRNIPKTPTTGNHKQGKRIKH